MQNNISDNALNNNNSDLSNNDNALVLKNKFKNDIALSNRFAVQAAYMQNYLNGTDILPEVLKNKEDPNIKNKTIQLSAQKTLVDSKQLLSTVQNNPTLGTGDVGKTVNLMQGVNKVLLADAKNTDRNFSEAAMRGSIPLKQFNNEVANQKLHTLLQETQSSVGLGDTLKTLAIGAIPFVNTFEQTSLTHSLFNSQKVMQQAIINYKLLPKQEQLQLFPALKKQLIDKLGKSMGVSALSKFIDPLGEQDLSGFSNVWKLFDLADLKMLSSVAKTFISSRNTIKTLKELGNIEDASKTTVASLADNTIKETVPVDTVTAVNNALPFDVSMADTAYTKGISTATQNIINNTFNKIDKTVNDIVSSNSYLKEGILNTKERAKTELEVIAKMRNLGYENVNKVSEDHNSATFSYNVMGTDGIKKLEERTVTFTRDKVGTFGQEKVGITSNFLTSPAVFAKKNTKLDVNTAQRLDYLTEKVNNQLLKLREVALAPLGNLNRKINRESLKKVDNALIKGDEFFNSDSTRGKVFTTDELRTGFNLNENEIAAYYNSNRLYNNLLVLRNTTKRDEMLSLGYKNIDFGLTGESSFGQLSDSEKSAATLLKSKDANFVFDASEGKIVEVGKNIDNILEKAYNENKVLVSLGEAYNTGLPEGKVLYTLVDKNNISDLPSFILHRKKGYVPRVYKNGAYFVKKLEKTTVDGKPFKLKKTLRFFNNLKDANIFRQEMVTQEINSGMSETEAEKMFVSLSDREEEIINTAIGGVAHGTGGLYTGARTQDSILYGLEGTKPERLNSFEAMNINISNVSRYTSINSWRLGIEQRWINSVNEYLNRKGINSFVTKFGGLPDSIKSTDAGAFFARMEKQIRDWQGFPSREEQIYKTTVQRLVDWSSEKGFKKISNLLGNIGSKDPISAARGAAFHSLLGWFNPVQLWVQAQGMAVAVSLGMFKSNSRSFKNTIALTLLGEGENIGEKRIALAAMASGGDKKELSHIKELWDKTGYADSVTQTADYAAPLKGHGIALSTIKKAADNGLLFYRHGELLNRRMSFLTALERYKEKTGISLDMITNEHLKNIVDDSNNMMLGLTRANRAAFQKGIFSLPTQFLQVSTKFVETAIGSNGNFTRGEINKILLGQIALYGTAGVPVIGLPIMWLMQATGVTQKEIDANPGLVKTANDGFWGAVTFWGLDLNIESSSRGSLLRGLTDFVNRWAVTPSTIQSKMLGAFGTTESRFWNELTKQLAPITLGNYENAPLDITGALTMPFLKSIATWRDGEKAVIMHSLGVINDKNNTPIVKRKFSPMEDLAAAIGFRLTDETRKWDLQAIEKYHSSSKKKLASLILGEMNSYALKANTIGLSEKDKEDYSKTMSFLTKAAGNPKDNEDVSKMVMKTLENKGKNTASIIKYKNSMITNGVSQLSDIQNFFLGNKIPTLNKN